jgi:hypothetical protein
VKGHFGLKSLVVPLSELASCHKSGCRAPKEVSLCCVVDWEEFRRNITLHPPLGALTSCLQRIVTMGSVAGAIKESVFQMLVVVVNFII